MGIIDEIRGRRTTNNPRADQIGYRASVPGSTWTTVAAALDGIEALYIIPTASKYGAKGDGITDDYAALMAAFNDGMSSGRPVLVPPGDYHHSQPFVFNSRITIIGCGVGAFSLSTSSTIFTRTADFDSFTLLGAGSLLEKFEITAVTPGTKGGVVIGAADSTNGAGRCVLRDMLIHHLGGPGVWAKNGNGQILFNVQGSANGQQGILLNSQWTGGAGSNVNACVLIASEALSNAGTGMDLDLASSNTVLGFISEGNGDYGLNLGNTYNFVTGYVESNTDGGLRTGASGFGNVMFVRNVNADVTLFNRSNWMHLMGGINEGGKEPQQHPRGKIVMAAAIAETATTVTFNPPTPIFIGPDLANEQWLTVTSNTNFTIPAPSATALGGQRFRLRILNKSGGAMGTITWDANYLMGSGWVNPANGFTRWIDFTYTGSGNLWQEAGRSERDIPNW